MAHRVVPAQAEHVPVIARNVRPADAEELWAIARISPEAALRSCLCNSEEAWAGLIDEEPVCLFGVATGSALTGLGVPWMIGTTAIERHATAFLRGSREVIEEMFSKYDRLENMIDVRNVRAIRWLRWLGFTVADTPIPAGPQAMPFLPFARGR